MTEPPETKRAHGVTRIFGVRRRDEPGADGSGPGVSTVFAATAEADGELRRAGAGGKTAGRRVIFGARGARPATHGEAAGQVPALGGPESAPTGPGAAPDEPALVPDELPSPDEQRMFARSAPDPLPGEQSLAPVEPGGVPDVEEADGDEPEAPDVAEVREQETLVEIEDWGFAAGADPLGGEPTEELRYLLEQKAGEFLLLGYGFVTPNDLWAYFQGLKKDRPRQLHEVVGAILSLQPQAYMNESLKRAYQAPPLRLEDFRIEDFL